jgi:hypothetical protein
MPNTKIILPSDIACSPRARAIFGCDRAEQDYRRAIAEFGIGSDEAGEAEGDLNEATNRCIELRRILSNDCKGQEKHD